MRALNPDLESKMKIGNTIVLPAENIRKYGSGQQIASATSPETTTTDRAVITQTTESTKTVDADSYEIQPKDNYFRIGRKFGLSQSQLFALNPGLEARGLQPGEIIKVRGAASQNVSNSSQNETAAAPSRSMDRDLVVIDDYVTYTVKDGDTVFGILNRFNVTLDQLLTLNPNLANGLKSGMVLKIRKMDEAYVKKDNDGLNVVLMLPFGFNSSDSKFRSMSADFLSGAKLALERNARNGQKINVKVIDAGNETSFKNSLTQINQNNTDLIVGPFLKSNVLETLDYVGSKKIPVVAPFANAEELYGYSNLIMAEPSDDVYADRISKEISQIYKDQKIYIVAGSSRDNANLLKGRLDKSLKNPNISIVNSPLDIQADKNMMTGQSAPVIAVLASSDDNDGESFANRIVALTKETSGVRAFSMYYHPSFEKKVDELSQANFVYLMDRKINTEGNFEKMILNEYRQKYCKTPPKYAIIGFDVMNDILSRENNRGEVFRQIGKVQTQLATKFEYVRAKSNGAYINTGYRVVRLVP